MIHHQFPAMGTRIEAWCESPDDCSRLETWFESVESVCSRFRPESELSILNRSFAGSVKLSPLLLEVISAADHARTITGGMVEAGLGGAVEAWGYDRTIAEVRDLDSPPADLRRPDWHLETGYLIRSPQTRIDVGGTCKGWTCDRAVANGLASVVSAGGDIRSADPSTVVSVEDPWGKTAARVRLGVGAFATSSTTRRRWRVGGREVSHVIDPRTLAPIESPVMSASVVASSGVDAEAGAKTVLMLGEEGLSWADQTDWIRGAMVVWHDGGVFATKDLELAV